MRDTSHLRINGERLIADIHALAEIGRDESGVLYRPAFSPAYEKARAWMKSRCEGVFDKVRDDPAGNVIARMGPDATPCVMSGSHIDTVRDGGPLDGAYGVLAGIEVGRVLKEAGFTPDKSFECVAFVDEEGSFLDCLGSKAISGALNAAEIASAKNAAGEMLIHAMANAGFDPLKAVEALRSPDEIDAFVELHIEQGPTLETIGKDVGNVEAIVGTSNLWLTFEGEQNHAGATPMDLRKDPFAAAAEFSVLARCYALEHGTPDRVRITNGFVEITPNVHNVIPKKVRLFQEIRDCSDDVIEALENETSRIAREIADRHRVHVQIDKIPGCRAAPMSDRVRGVIAGAAERFGVDAHDMPSGAVHDAQHMARVADAGLIFAPSEGGRSHCGDEYTEERHLILGANVLLHSVIDLMNAWG